MKILAAKLCRTLFDPMDCSPPGSSVHGILQARILNWVAIPFSRGSSWSRDQTHVSCIAGRFFTIWANREAHHDSSSPQICWKKCLSCWKEDGKHLEQCLGWIQHLINVIWDSYEILCVFHKEGERWLCLGREEGSNSWWDQHGVAMECGWTGSCLSRVSPRSRWHLGPGPSLPWESSFHCEMLGSLVSAHQMPTSLHLP